MSNIGDAKQLSRVKLSFDGGKFVVLTVAFISRSSEANGGGSVFHEGEVEVHDVVFIKHVGAGSVGGVDTVNRGVLHAVKGRDILE